MRIGRVEILWSEDWALIFGATLFGGVGIGVLPRVVRLPLFLQVPAVHWAILIGGIIWTVMGVGIPSMMLYDNTLLRNCPRCGTMLRRVPLHGPGKYRHRCPSCNYERFTGVEALPTDNGSHDNFGGGLLDHAESSRGRGRRPRQ